MESKAISPMIAVVLLIAFTVAVGGIMSLWLTGYTTTTTGSVETASTNQTKCSGTYIDVISVANKSILITNRGSQTIEDITCYTANGTVLGILNGGTSDDLSVGTMLSSSTWNSTAVNESDTGYISSYGTSVLCTGSCLNIGVTGECKSGQTCWKV
jgi:flagellin-like protein